MVQRSPPRLTWARSLASLEVRLDRQGRLQGQHQHLQRQDERMQELQYWKRVCEKNTILTWQKQPQDVGSVHGLAPDMGRSGVGANQRGPGVLQRRRVGFK